MSNEENSSQDRAALNDGVAKKETQENPNLPKKKIRRVDDDEKLPLTVHLEELRWRLIYSAAIVFIIFIVVYSLSDHLLEILKEPVKDFGLYAISPTEIFFSYLRISLYGSLILAFPLLAYQAWEFIAPGLLKPERKYSGLFLIFGSLFFIMGVLFCYFVVLPQGMNFLLNFGGGSITAQITISYYLEFALKLVLAFGIVFETPIVLILLVQLNIVSHRSLSHIRPYYIVGSFIFAAILTPPDIFTQLALATPMIILFEFSLLFTRLFIRKDEPVIEEQE
ncbi:MAG: twin-arginine translocase subunit TatC [Nitrospinota bacterium]